MKRTGHLIEKVADLGNLYLAFRKACRGKYCKGETRDFLRNFDENISSLRQEILSGNADVGHYHYFWIRDPKERLICATTLRERILHHAIMNVCHEFFDRSLIGDTYATRKGKGVYAALEKAVKAAGRYRYLVKLDFRKYYDSIDHKVLEEKLERKFKDRRLLQIFSVIIASYHTTEGCGLPIGNLTSQYFANLYLSELDHKAKEHWKFKAYVRYMDDILIAGDDKGQLAVCVAQLQQFASNSLHLRLKPPVISDSKRGIVFLGYHVLPYRYRLSGRSKRRFRSKLIGYQKMFDDGRWTERRYEEHILPLMAFASHAQSRNFRQSCLEISGDNREWV